MCKIQYCYSKKGYKWRQSRITFDCSVTVIYGTLFFSFIWILNIKQYFSLFTSEKKSVGNSLIDYNNPL